MTEQHENNKIAKLKIKMQPHNQINDNFANIVLSNISILNEKDKDILNLQIRLFQKKLGKHIKLLSFFDKIWDRLKPYLSFGKSHSIQKINKEIQKENITTSEIIEALVKIDVSDSKDFAEKLTLNNQELIQYLLSKREIIEAKPNDGFVLSVIFTIEKLSKNKDINDKEINRQIKKEANNYIKQLSYFYKLWDLFQGENSIQKINQRIQKSPNYNNTKLIINNNFRKWQIEGSTRNQCNNIFKNETEDKTITEKQKKKLAKQQIYYTLSLHNNSLSAPGTIPKRPPKKTNVTQERALYSSKND